MCKTTSTDTVKVSTPEPTTKGYHSEGLTLPQNKWLEKFDLVAFTKDIKELGEGLNKA